MHIDPDATIRGHRAARLLLPSAVQRAHARATRTPCPCPKSCRTPPTSSPASSAGLFKTLLLLPDVALAVLHGGAAVTRWPTRSRSGRTTAPRRTTGASSTSWPSPSSRSTAMRSTTTCSRATCCGCVSYHSGNGWYLEQTYNYYTISLFIVYGTIWNRTFGDEHYPEIAAAIENSARELMKTYPSFFGRDGYDQHVGAEHLLPHVDLGRLPGIVHAEGQSSPGSRLGATAMLGVAAPVCRRARTSTRTTSRASAFTAIANSCCRTTVARPVRS